ncbi:hypothetical protein [Roseinatronobacter alkalisoli]|uniref:Uncharacterized protein n=1 Tax=Roseinatronobacter alkalisoli TaxID=3028235 RepID=A0ABT5TAT4_9RHOB|nr:hypothetical protein [Roseinatronobacter sp. HJB301]MDD7972189.1 hypothetical protein [Roseinatronobacter sp. HJB301]
MSRMDYFSQGGTPFDGFLYAELGQDRAGNTVSVLSALARLGRDPWDEAAELSAMSSAVAQTRLGVLLARFHDVPAVDRDPRATIPRLVALLPSSTAQKTGAGNVLPAGAKVPGIGAIIAVLMMVIVFLLQTFIFGSAGTGD